MYALRLNYSEIATERQVGQDIINETKIIKYSLLTASTSTYITMYMYLSQSFTVAVKKKLNVAFLSW